MILSFPGGSVVRNLPANAESSLSREDPLEKEMATYSSFLPGKSHGQRNLSGYSPRGHKESDTTEHIDMQAILLLIPKIKIQENFI